MSATVAERVRSLPCIAVNDAFRLAPWARALVAGDRAWWKHTPDALAFAGDKWCATDCPGTRKIAPTLGSHINSGLHGLERAVRHYGATRVLLCGVDLCGKHFFGDHALPLKNPEAARFQLFRAQFETYARTIRGRVEVVNCSPISTLECFPKVALEEALECATA